MKKEKPAMKGESAQGSSKESRSKEEKSMRQWWFLAACISAYIITMIIRPESAMDIIDFFVKILIKVIPILALIFVLLAAISYLVKPKKLLKYFGKEAGTKGYLLSLVAGIISTGPIFMWYPLMNDMQKHGVSNGFLATFLYGRAVKPALIPMLILYFGLAYTAVITIVIGITAIVQGIIVNMIDDALILKKRRPQEVEK